MKSTEPPVAVTVIVCVASEAVSTPSIGSHAAGLNANVPAVGVGLLQSVRLKVFQSPELTQT